MESLLKEEGSAVSDQPDIHWEGQSGKEYGYWIVVPERGMRFVREAGNFIAARKLKSGIWEPLFVGQAEDLDAALPGLLEQPCIEAEHGTHLHVHPGPSDEQARLEEARDIIVLWSPVCNASAD